LKPATIIGMSTATLAVILYSIGVWAAFRKKEFTGKHLLLIDLGLVFDFIATMAMASTNSGMLKLNTTIWVVKTVIALLAMDGMVGLTVLGYWAKGRGDSKFMTALTRWALAPWALWVFVYLWGSARIGLK
jgi:hypothetical protein